MIIYKITNLINNKVYIGQTIGTLEKRWKRHTWECTRKRNAMAITNAIIKYGMDNFTIEEIYKASTMEELNDKEIYYISILNTISPNGYNIDNGGGNKSRSDETRAKISLAHKNRWDKGERISEETRKKLSESHKGYVPSEETKKKLREFFKGKKPSENTRRGSIEYNQKTYTLLNPNGELVTFTNMKNFCKENNLSNSKLCLVASGKRRSHRGWTIPDIISNTH